MDKEWKADWIVDPRFKTLEPLNLFHKEMEKVNLPAHPAELQNQHMLLRKVFFVDDPIKTSILDITADDYYKVYINGILVGQGPAPGYYFHYNYNRYHVARYLHTGINVIAVDVYYQGLINRTWNSGDYRQGMIAELFIDDILKVKTDSSWKYVMNLAYQAAPVTCEHNTQYLEYIDARLFSRGWQGLDYDDAVWSNAEEKQTDDHNLFLQITPSQQIYFIKPAQRSLVAPGHYLLDFGEEITGTFMTQCQGCAGDKIEVRYGEELDSKGRVRYQLRCECLYQDFWIFSGGYDSIEFYDYKGFRYVEVIGPGDALNPETFAVRVQHYPFDENACEFKTDNDLLNQIWSVCKRGVRNGCQEVYVDCPTREKGQYLGDTLVTAHSQVYLTGDLRLLKKAVQDYALSSRLCPGLMAVAPGSLMQEIADYTFQWPLLLMLYYQHSGDMAILRKMLPVGENLLTYFDKYRRPDGLLENVTDKWNLIDWPPEFRDNYDFPITKPIGPGCHNVLNAFYLGAIKTVNEIKDILNLKYKNELPALIQNFKNAFYRNETGLFVDSEISSHSSQQSNILPLFFGLIERKDSSRLVAFLKKKRFSCSVYMAYFLLKSLARAGEYEFIYELITCSDKASWVTMLNDGASSCFEAWGKDQKRNTSLCHPWSSCPISVLIEDILGLKPGKPGWKAIHFDPHIPDAIKSWHLKIKTISGDIRVDFRNGEKAVIFTSEILPAKERPSTAAGPSEKGIAVDIH